MGAGSSAGCGLAACCFSRSFSSCLRFSAASASALRRACSASYSSRCLRCASVSAALLRSNSALRAASSALLCANSAWSRNFRTSSHAAISCCAASYSACALTTASSAFCSSLLPYSVLSAASCVVFNAFCALVRRSALTFAVASIFLLARSAPSFATISSYVRCAGVRVSAAAFPPSCGTVCSAVGACPTSPVFGCCGLFILFTLFILTMNLFPSLSCTVTSSPSISVMRYC